MLDLQKTVEYMKNKFLHNNIYIKKINKIIFNKYLGPNWSNSIKDKTALFANKNDEYEEKNQKKTAKQLKKLKLHPK